MGRGGQNSIKTFKPNNYDNKNKTRIKEQSMTKNKAKA